MSALRSTFVLVSVCVSASSLTPESCSASGQVFCPASTGCLDYGDCPSCAGHQVEDVDDKVCLNRTVFSDWLWQDVVGLLFWFVGSGLAMAAGVGGGGIFVPMGILLLRFQSKAATGLSQASIFGASLAGLILNLQRRHPKADRPLIDFDMALFLAPMEMSGAIVGVVIQKALPEWLVILLMSVILSYTAVRTFKKGISTHAKEKAAKAKELEAAAKSAAQPMGEPAQLVNEGPTHDVSRAELPAGGEMQRVATGEDVKLELEEVEAADSKKAAREAMLAKDASAPWLKYGYLVLVWVTLVLMMVLRGGKGMDSAIGIKHCSGGYWAMSVACLLWLGGFATVMGGKAVKQTLERQAVEFPFVEGDVQWTWQSMRYYSLWTFVAGVIAGIIGIGGGMILGPLMLELGSLPQVSTATTATLIALTSSSAGGMFIISGLVPLDYALLFMGTAFVGAFVGKSIIDDYVKRHRLTSLLVFILGSIIAFASVMVMVAGLLKYADRGWAFEGFKTFC